MRLLTSDQRSAGLARLALVAAFAALVAFAGVFTMPPLDRDEARFAQATAQMLESGDFVRIHFQEDERNKKPVGVHWLQAGSVALFSSAEARDIWAYRLPSVLGAVLAAVFTYLIGARLYGPQTGVLAALLLASAPAVAGEATIAKTDSMLLAAVTAAQVGLLYVYAAIEDGRRASFAAVALFWIAVCAGLYLKGPIILLVIGLTIAGLFWRRPHLGWLQGLRPIGGAIFVAATIAPWALLIHDATDGRFFAEAIGGDMLAKIGDAKESHSGPPGYYLVLLFLLFLPAAALIPAAAQAAIASRRTWRSWFLLSWIAPTWIVFELTATKLPHYTLPLYPAIALFAAHAALDATTQAKIALGRIGAALYLVLGLGAAAATIALPIIYQQATLSLYAAISGGGLALATLAAALLHWRRQVVAGTLVSIAMSAALAWTLLAGVLPHLDRLAVSSRLAAAIASAGLHPIDDAAPPAILSGYQEPSAIFLLGTGAVIIDGAGAADRLIAFGGAAAVEQRQLDAFERRLVERDAGADLFAVIDGVNYSNGDDVSLHLYRKPNP